MENTAALLEKLRSSPNPGVRYVALSAFASKASREGQITLYEDYTLMAEALAYERQAYLQPGWNNRVHISHLICMLNMKMLALLFREDAAAAMWDEWGMEAYRLNQEKRAHYILDDYPAFLRGGTQALEKLLAQRRSRRHPFDKGPYHDELFPGGLCACEEMLLQGRYFPDEDKKLSGEVEALLVELYLIQEGDT